MLARGAPPVTSFACAVELIREDGFGVDAVRSGGPPRRYCRKGRRVIGLVYMETTAWRLSRPAPPRPRPRGLRVRPIRKPFPRLRDHMVIAEHATRGLRRIECRHAELLLHLR